MKKISLVVKVKQLLSLLFFTLMFSDGIKAQYMALKGSGIVVNKTYAFSNFKKVALQDLDGEITIEVGKAYTIGVAVDDNLQALFEVSETDETLNIKIKGNKNNKLYIENTKIKIRITVPYLIDVLHSGNSGLKISGLKGENFELLNDGNGSVNLLGSIEKLKVVNNGNGNVEASKLLATKVIASKIGNGTIYINTNNPFNALSEGNGDIINEGIGKADGNSKNVGNGVIKNKND